MVVGCVQHYSTQSKKLQKRAKKGPKMLILGYFDIFDIFGPFLLILNKKKIKISKKKLGKFNKFKKLGPKMLILAYFGPKNNCMVKMTTPYPSPYCALSSCKILGNNNEPFLR